MSAIKLPDYLEQQSPLYRLEKVRRESFQNRHDLTTPDGIVWFVREVLCASPTSYQEEILCALATHGRVAVRGPHGLGKTAIAAWVILWGMTAFSDDVKVPTTASAWRQLKHFLWPEVRKWAARADWSRLGLQMRQGKELLQLSLKLAGKEAFPVASDKPELIEGAHAQHLIYVFDEAKTIPNDTWDAAEGAFSGAGEDTDAVAYALAISTPGESVGRFYDIHRRKRGYENWWTRHVTLEEAIAAGRISRQWAEQRLLAWGEQSAVYQNRVLGDFADAGDDALIRLSWVEQANERWYNRGGHGEGSRVVGVDPARYGEDATTMAFLVGMTLERLEYHHKEDTMQTAGRVAAAIDRETPVAIDVIGLGAGVYDRLREQGYQVLSVNVAERTNMKDSSGQLGFVNLRSALWWLMREALDPQNDVRLALPPDDRLTGDLTAPHWTYRSAGGLIEVESKDKIRERLGRSTDAADALIMAYYAAIRGNVSNEFTVLDW